jgi:hypothetical protein
LEKFPKLKVPDGFEERRESAVQAVLEKMMRARGLEAGFESRLNTVVYRDPDDSGMEDDSDDDDMNKKKVALAFMEVKQFLEVLPQCVILDLGFQVQYDSDKEQVRTRTLLLSCVSVARYSHSPKHLQCYCPCSNKGLEFRLIFGGVFCELTAAPCESDRKFGPKGLVNHLKSKSDSFHHAIHLYLSELYNDFLQVKGEAPVRHHAFSNGNDAHDRRYSKLRSMQFIEYVRVLAS